MFYYYKDNEYVGCGNEDVMQGCEVRSTPPPIIEPDTILQAALSYLSSTDFKMLGDYVPEEGSESLDSIKTKRAAARATVRELTI